MKSGNTKNKNSMVNYMDTFARGLPSGIDKAMFYFLYKEILLNRINILESDLIGNRGAIEHNEKIINELNTKLMKEIESNTPEPAEIR